MRRNMIFGILYGIFAALLFAVTAVITFTIPIAIGDISSSSQQFHPMKIGSWLATMVLVFAYARLAYFLIKTPPGNHCNDPIAVQGDVEIRSKLGISGHSYRLLSTPSSGLYTFFGKYRTVVISQFYMIYLSERELLAALAHEYAHHLISPMEVHRVHYLLAQVLARYKSVADAAYRLPEDFTVYFLRRMPGAMSKVVATIVLVSINNFVETCLVLLKPVGVALNWYVAAGGRLFDNKEHELSCDRIAAELYGGDSLISALEKIIYIDHLIARAGGRDIKSLLDEGMADKEGMASFLAAIENEETRSHPSLISRRQALAGIAA